MNVYNFLNYFDKRTDVIVHTTMLVCNTLFVYVEVEE